MQQTENKNRKQLIRVICMAFAAVFLTGCKAEANVGDNAPQTPVSVAGGMFTDNKNGTVSFSYNNKYKEKCKVVTRIEGGKMYQYDIPTGQCDFVFPLSQGNGNYQVYLCRNTTGNKYSVIASASIDVDVADERSIYLGSNYIINWNTENKAIKKAFELTKDMTEDEEKINAIYEYMVKNFSYDFEKMESVQEGAIDEAYVPNIDATFASKMGICYDLSALTASMLRSVSVPARVVTGYSANTVSYHAWNSIYYMPKEEWRTIDITYDIQMYKDGKRYYMFKKDEYYSNVMYLY